MVGDGIRESYWDFECVVYIEVGFFIIFKVNDMIEWRKVVLENFDIIYVYIYLIV